ncbi:hypothetical protein TSH100_20350 [Azospirillum sp. TSH100]|uniref:bacteriohemerythrin n=1 Tax=Azospirillum sp. TSH100 TaxID=652764 RepID=UPI000D60A186|nr:hemerythrin family protein [Azospirillum sp. TSH100]PWC83562.1 hypothetical protein TSH100_20350 [Azospirillum sp. TSH100]QCG87589.1 bacteriohemerythrin [Azospirillum sp. TSH100]
MIDSKKTDTVDYGRLVWSDDLLLGVGAIDEQHREWIGLVQAFERAVCEGRPDEEMRRTLAAAVAYTESHFADEQRVMEESGYPFLDDHIGQHQLAWDRVHAFASGEVTGDVTDDEMRRSLAEFLPQWLMLHINTADRQFARWLKGTAAPGTPAGPDGRVFGDIPV